MIAFLSMKEVLSLKCFLVFSKDLWMHLADIDYVASVRLELCRQNRWGGTAGSGWMGKQAELVSLSNPCNISLFSISKVKLNNILFIQLQKRLPLKTQIQCTAQLLKWKPDYCSCYVTRGHARLNQVSSDRQQPSRERSLRGAKMGSNWWECSGTG